MISYDDFKKVEVKVGKILSAEKVEKTDKLLKLSVDFGFKMVVEIPPQAVPQEPAGADASANSALVPPAPVETKVSDIRQIVSGIAEYYPDPQVVVGVSCMFVTNLEPRVIRGLESQGMIFAVGGGDQPLGLLVPNAPVVPGTQAK